ncbi:hypothetical protein DFH07DRAFT_848683 [Mycena maculata]|uniref:DUF6534 domain-containing protein n=1 Tax=Mycena maculata TaxID=230809 RepID=A0AAD7HZ71_9AGAR|nr:hypothetical protein DFH07DRAFT_848683 [Mycena maculata]
MAAIPAAPQLPSLFPTWGVTLIGATFSTILYGVVCLQTFLYYRQWQKDNWFVKLLVGVVFFLDTFNQVQVTFMVYHYFVLNFANPLALHQNHWTIGTEILSNAIIGFLVEGFLVFRVWRLSNSIVLSGIGATLTLAHLGTNAAPAIIGYKYDDLLQMLAAIKPVATGGIALGAVEDTTLALTLCYCLYHERTGFKRTDSMLLRLISMTIATGLVTSLVIIAQLISITAAPQTLWILAWNLQLPKLYTNSLLATLNARGAIRNASAPQNHLNSFNTATALDTFDTSGTHTRNANGSRTHVNITKSETSHADDYSTVVKVATVV